MNLEKRQVRLLLQALFGAGLIAIWQISHYFMPMMPTPLETIGAMYSQFLSGDLSHAVLHATYAIFGGFLLACFVGVSLGLLMGLNKNFEDFFDPYVNALYATPLSAVVPVLIIWFGTGLQVRIVAVFMLAFFPILITTLQGVREVPGDLVAATRSFGAEKWFLIRNVVIPHEIPYILTGFRLGMARSVKGLVIAELLISVTGFGGIIHTWTQALRLEGVFSVVIVLMLMGVLFTWMVSQIETYAVAWDIEEITV